MAGREFFCRDDSDLLFLVELLVKLLIFTGDILNEYKSLVLSQNGQEVKGDGVEFSNFVENLVQLSDFLDADTTVLGELAEHSGVDVKLRKVHHVLVDVEQGITLGGSSE